MAGFWPCLLLALVTSRRSLGFDIIASHSRNLASHPADVGTGNAATQAAASYHDRSPHPRRLGSSYQGVNNFEEHRAEDTKMVVGDDYEYGNARPAMDTPFSLFKTIHPSPQSKLQKMQQQFENRIKSIPTTFSEGNETEVATFVPITNSKETKASTQVISSRDRNEANPINFASESFNIHSLFKNIEIDTRDNVKKDVRSEPLPESSNRLPEQTSLYDHPTGSEVSFSTKTANQQRSESNLFSNLKGTLTDLVENTVNFFHPTRSGDGEASFHEQSRKIDSGSFRQTLLEYFQNSKPSKFSAVEDFTLEKIYDAENSRLKNLSTVEKTNHFEKHSILKESNTRMKDNSGKLVPTSWSGTDEIQLNFDDEPEFSMLTGFNEMNSDHEIQLEDEMDSLSGIVNSTMTLEILETIQPVLSDALEHANFTEEELMNLLEDPDRLRQALIQKTTEDHAFGLLDVFQHYKGLSTYELLQNMTRLDPSDMSRHVERLASQVRDSLLNTWGSGTLFDDTEPRIVEDSQYSESSMYPAYPDETQLPPPEYTASRRAEYPYNFPQLGQYEDAQTRIGSINISNPLFNFTFVSPKVTFPTFAALHNLTYLNQKLNSTGYLLKLPLLALLTQTSIIGLGALLALLIGSHYLKHNHGHGYESSYILVSPKSGYNSRMYAKKQIIMELPAKKNLENEYHRSSTSVKMGHGPKIIGHNNLKTISIPKRNPHGGLKKTHRLPYHSVRPPHRSDKHDSFDNVYYDEFGNPQIEYFINEHGEEIDHPGKGDPFIFESHKDVGSVSRQLGRSKYRGSYEKVRDSSVLHLDSSNEYYRRRNKPRRDRYYERSREGDERSRETRRRKKKRPDQYRHSSREKKRDIYASWEKGRTSVSRPFLSLKDDSRTRHRSQSSRRPRGSKSKYRGNVLVEDVLSTPPISMKIELGVPYFEDDGKTSRRLRSSDAWMSNLDQSPSSSSQEVEYSDNMAQFGSHSASLSRSPARDTFRGRSESNRRPKYTAASPAMTWALEAPSHTSPHGSESQPKDLVVWSDHPLPTSWSKESTRSDPTLPSLEPFAIKDSSPISKYYDVFGNINDGTNYPEQQPGREKDDARRTLDRLLQKYRSYTTKFLSTETTVIDPSATVHSGVNFTRPLVPEKQDGGFVQRLEDLEMPRKSWGEKKRKRVQSGGFQKTPGVAGNSRGSSDRAVRPRQMKQGSTNTMSPSLKDASEYIRSFFNPVS